MGGVRVVTAGARRRSRLELSEGHVRMLELVARDLHPTAAAAALAYAPFYGYTLMAEARDVLGVETNTGAVIVAVGLGLIGLPGVDELRITNYELRIRDEEG